jgi:DNA-binding transcriptional MocR family regulator
MGEDRISPEELSSSPGTAPPGGGRHGALLDCLPMSGADAARRASRRILLDGQPPAWPPEALALFERCEARAFAPAHTSRRLQAEDPSLRDALASELGHDPDALTVTPGVRSVAAAVASAGRPISIERPTFQGVDAALKDGGGPHRAEPWARLASDSLPERAIVWLTTPYRNPDGACLDDELLPRYAALAKARCLVQNEIYGFYSERPRRIPGAVYVGSLHKLAGPRSLIGWVAGPDVERLAARERLPSVPARRQRVWARFAEEGGLRLLLPAMAAATRARRSFQERLSLPARDTGPFVLLDAASESAALTYLAERGVAVNPGSAFDAPGALRVCFSGATCEEAEYAADVVRSGVEAGVLGAALQRVL